MSEPALCFLFAGNQCRKILHNIDLLHIPEELSEFEVTLRALNSLYSLSQKRKLQSNYKEVVIFLNCFLELHAKFNVSITNKIHIIMGKIHISMK